MMIPLSHKLMIMLLLGLTVHLENVRAGSCDNQKIIHVVQNDTLTVTFLSNDLLKLDREIQCPSQTNWTMINTCNHKCTGLVYGEHFQADIQMTYPNGTIVSCSIENETDLQKPLLESFNVTNDQIFLTVRPPLGSFDYFTVRCLDGFALNSTSKQPITVNCSVIPNVALTNILLESVKEGYQTVINRIDQEVPLPIPFNYTVDGLLLRLMVEKLPDINLFSSYEFVLGFFVNETENLYYEQQKVFGFSPDRNETFRYGLLPNMTYVVTLKHIAPSVGYAENSTRFRTTSDTPYPYAVRDLRVREDFNNIFVSWNDSHEFDAPVEFVIVCNSRTNVEVKLAKEASYICQQMTFNQTDSIVVYTRVAIPGYTHDRFASASVDVRAVPDAPEIVVTNRTENSITIRWDHTTIASAPSSAIYQIQCDLDLHQNTTNIQSDEYQCTSLSSGTLYIITMKVSNAAGTFERVRRVQANTLLPKCQYNTHFYPPDVSNNRSVIIEWTPPDGEFEMVQVVCPFSSVSFEKYQLMPTMYMKCSVNSGEEFNVIFLTTKSGYETAVFEFRDTAPIDPGTTTTSTSTPGMGSTATASGLSTTTTTTPRPGGTTTTITRTVPGSNTTSATPARTTTTTPSRAPGVTTTTTATAQTGPAIGSCSSCCSDKDNQISRWKIVAIIGFILAGFFLLVAICLLILSISLRTRR